MACACVMALCIFVSVWSDRAGAQRAEVMFTRNSRELRMWFSMISSRMIAFKKVMVKTRQVLHPS